MIRKPFAILVLVVPCHLTYSIIHGQGLLSLRVESSAKGGSFNASCLLSECAASTWTSNVNEDSPLLPFPGEGPDLDGQKQWWRLSNRDGIILQVIHEITSRVLLTKTFNTWHPFTYAKALVWWIDQVKAGRIIAMTVHRSAMRGLEQALPFLVSLGSILAPYAPSRALWTWVFFKGGKTMIEALSDNPHPLQFSQTVLLTHSLIQTLNNFSILHKNQEHSIHSQICNSHAGLKSVCENESLINTNSIIPSFPIMQTNNHNIGILLCAGGSIQHLAYTLHHLFSNPKITKSMILVAVGTNMQNGEANPSVISLLQMFQLQHKVIKVPLGAPSINHHLFQYYRGAWMALLEAFPTAKYLAFLDEDVEVSSDWLDLLLHAAPALDKDPTLWCVSGITASHRNMNPDPQMMLRASRQPGWGFLLRRKHVKEAVSVWPSDSKVSVLYDNFLYRVLAKGRECIYPALSRAHHYGVGINTVPQIHQLYFLDIPLHNGKDVRLPSPESLTWDNYERRVRLSIKYATPITREPCAPGFLAPADFRFKKNYVFYFFMDSENAPEWATLAECVGAWPYSTQGMHRGSVELPKLGGGSLWLVGVPFSPYSSLKPSNIPVWQPASSDSYLQHQSAFVASLYLSLNSSNRSFEMVMSQLSQEN